MACIPQKYSKGALTLILSWWVTYYHPLPTNITWLHTYLHTSIHSHYVHKYIVEQVVERVMMEIDFAAGSWSASVPTAKRLLLLW